MKLAAITGAGGFIGSTLARRLAHQGVGVRALTGPVGAATHRLPASVESSKARSIIPKPSRSWSPAATSSFMSRVPLRSRRPSTFRLNSRVSTWPVRRRCWRRADVPASRASSMCHRRRCTERQSEILSAKRTACRHGRPMRPRRSAPSGWWSPSDSRTAPKPSCCVHSPSTVRANPPAACSHASCGRCWPTTRSRSPI